MAWSKGAERRVRMWNLGRSLDCLTLVTSGQCKEWPGLAHGFWDFPSCSPSVLGSLLCLRLLAAASLRLRMLVHALSSINLSQHRGLFLHATTPKAKSALASPAEAAPPRKSLAGSWRGAQSGVSVVRDVMLAQQKMEPNRCVSWSEWAGRA